MNKISLLILAAGMGSRYQGQKQIDGVGRNGESLMEYALYDALQVGISKFVFVVNAQFPDELKQKFIRILDKQNAEIHFVTQTIDKFIPNEFKNLVKDRIKPLGTAHAVYCAKEIIKEPFLTMNADDFYGRESFELAFEHATSIQATHYAMISFQLNRTLSEHGSVARGICSLEQNQLMDVEEVTSIELKDGKITGRNMRNQIIELKGDEQVSMNFWLLHPSYFGICERALSQFFAQKEVDWQKVEFYLPELINREIHQKKLSVRVLNTDEQWFGMTYRDDKTKVMQEIAQRQADGIYPTKLWPDE